MKNDRLIPGTILVIIGILFLLSNFNVIDFDWLTFLSLWPILLIMAGVNLVFAHNRTGWATTLKIAVLIVGMSILIYNGIEHHYRGFNFSFNNDREDYRDANSNNYVVAANDSIQVVRLNITGGATKYTLSDTTNQLFAADTKERGIGYTLNTSTDSTIETINFDMGNQRRHNFFVWGGTSNHVNLRLNPKPVWDIDVEGGAAKFSFDLSKYKIEELKFEGGAASLNIKMGEPLAETKLTFSTGASSININIPQNAACRITTDTGLSGKSFNGFNQKDDDTYETPGFDQAVNKMYINMEGGVSHFRVSRY
jgi:hypothetical protein